MPSLPCRPPPRRHAEDYLFFEGDAALGKVTLEYAGLAVAGVGLVLLITLVHPLSSLLMMISVGLVMLYLFGLMWIFGIRFNQVRIRGPGGCVAARRRHVQPCTLAAVLG
jgi:hypothetical protein